MQEDNLDQSGLESQDSAVGAHPVDQAGSAGQDSLAGTYPDKDSNVDLGGGVGSDDGSNGSGSSSDSGSVDDRGGHGDGSVDLGGSDGASSGGASKGSDSASSDGASSDSASKGSDSASSDGALSFSESELDALADASLQPEPESTEDVDSFLIHPVEVNDRERLARSKQTRNLLVVLIIGLFMAGGVLIWFGYNYIVQPVSQGQASLKPGNDLSPSDSDMSSSTQAPKFATTGIPSLISLFGLNIDEASAKLGKLWVLQKTDDVNDPATPNTKQLATFEFTARELDANGNPIAADATDTAGSAAGSSSTNLPTANLYLSLNDQGKIIDVYYAADMELLGYPETDFASLLANSKLVLNALASAGVEAKDYSYHPPDMAAATQYDNPGSNGRKVSKQSTVFSGRTTVDGLPSAWTVTVSYDFVPPTDKPASAQNTIRMLYIRLA